MVAENRGAKPNAAGAFAAIRIKYKDGSDEIIVTDEQWQVTDTVPNGNRPGRWQLDELEWETARLLPNTPWKNQTDARIGPTLANASAGVHLRVRASLLKADDLMRTLGRPNRDQIVTSRPNELTTLEAVDLSTSEDLMHHLRSGAEKLTSREELSTPLLVEEIYLLTLNRLPSDGENKLLVQSLGKSPSVDQVTDLLWAITMTPEFLFNR